MNGLFESSSPRWFAPLCAFLVLGSVALVSYIAGKYYAREVLTVPVAQTRVVEVAQPQARTVLDVINSGEHRATPFDRTTPSVVALHCVAVAVVIQAKATGLGPLEQLAIAEAIMTRSDMGEEGGHPCDIVLAPGQFLGVESFPPPRIPVYEDRDAWFLAQQVTLAAMKGDMRTPCHGATHYFEVADAPADKLRNACVLDKLAFIRIE